MICRSDFRRAWRVGRGDAQNCRLRSPPPNGASVSSEDAPLSFPPPPPPTTPPDAPVFAEHRPPIPPKPKKRTQTRRNHTTQAVYLLTGFKLDMVATPGSGGGGGGGGGGGHAGQLRIRSMFAEVRSRDDSGGTYTDLASSPLKQNHRSAPCSPSVRTTTSSSRGRPRPPRAAAAAAAAATAAASARAAAPARDDCWLLRAVGKTPHHSPNHMLTRHVLSHRAGKLELLETPYAARLDRKARRGGRAPRGRGGWDVGIRSRRRNKRSLRDPARSRDGRASMTTRVQAARDRARPTERAVAHEKTKNARRAAARARARVRVGSTSLAVRPRRCSRI